MGDVSNTVWCSCVALNDGIELFFLFLSFVSKRALVLSVSSLVDLLLSLNLLVDIDFIENYPIAVVARHPTSTVREDGDGLDVVGSDPMYIQVLMLRWSIICNISIDTNPTVTNVHCSLPSSHLVSEEDRSCTLIGMIMELQYKGHTITIYNRDEIVSDIDGFDVTEGS